MAVRREIDKPRRETRARIPAPGSSEQRIGDCSRSVHESCGLGPCILRF